jgi:hypothetical protein
MFEPLRVGWICTGDAVRASKQLSETLAGKCPTDPGCGIPKNRFGNSTSSARHLDERCDRKLQLRAGRPGRLSNLHRSRPHSADSLVRRNIVRRKP